MKRLMAVLFLLVVAAGCSTDRDRAAGITERWLQAVSDQGRDNLFTTAGDRAEEYGEPALIDDVLPRQSDRAEDERYFDDLEIGASEEEGDQARVPFRVTRTLAGGDTDELAATAVLLAEGDSWRVVGVDERATGEEVPSEGGERPASATAEHWLVAIGLGVVVTLASVALIELQPRPGRTGRMAE